MCKVAHGNCVLLVDVRNEGTLVVDTERKDAVLVRYLKGGGESGGVWRNRRRKQRKAVVRIEHSEFELEGVGGGDAIWDPLIVGVLG